MDNIHLRFLLTLTIEVGIPVDITTRYLRHRGDRNRVPDILLACGLRQGPVPNHT